MRPYPFIAGNLIVTCVILAWSLSPELTGERRPASHSSLTDTLAGRRRLAWIDRDGLETPIPAPPRAYVYPRLSPHGRLLALDIRDEPDGVWLWDFAGERLTPVSVGRASDIAPVWGHAGDWILFARGRGVAPGLWTVQTRQRGAGGSGDGRDQDATGLTRLPGAFNSLPMPTSLLPDDRYLLATTTAATGFDIVLLDVRGDGTPTRLVSTAADDLNAEVSPDGGWMAYQSRRSGRPEIWLRRVRDEVIDLQVTTDGGTRPAWTKGGRELVYLDAESQMVARSIDLSTGDPAIGPPSPLFAVDIYSDLVGRTFDVTPDGGRFLVILNR